MRNSFFEQSAFLIFRPMGKKNPSPMENVNLEYYTNVTELDRKKRGGNVFFFSEDIQGRG